LPRDLVHRVLHFGDGGVDVLAQLELNLRSAAAFRCGRTDRFTPGIERTAASTRWVIWVSISVGAAPGWVIGR
jgi:hypothetical protein